MRAATLIVAAALLTAGLTGCLSSREPLEPASEDDPAPGGADEAGDGAGDESGTDDDGSEAGSGDGDAGSGDGAGDTGTGDAGTGTDEDAVDHDRPTTVIAHLDTGINPYHEAFRDDSDLADVHPSEYIDGYPEDAEALELTLDADSYEEALEADEDVWANVTEGQLYWIPGTRIDGATTMGNGGAYCPIVGLPHDYLAGPLADEATDEVGSAGGPNPVECPEERPILDDFGHGTMTASRAAGDGTSMCPDCRIVSVEGTGADSVRWAADAGWIDVQTNSWIDLVPAPANQLAGDTTQATQEAAQQMVTVFASGNGAGYLFGGAPTPTYTLSTGPPGVVLVGAHDNGQVATWSGSPPHVVADGFRGLSATNDSMSEVGPIAFSCCTSSAAPYAAGAAAALVDHARDVLDDTSNGAADGVLAEGADDVVFEGPLADGDLTLDELRTVLFHTAQDPPQEGPHDGRMHWTGEVGGQPSEPTDPSGNPYCGLCWTSPVAYDQVPEDVPTYAYTGYGATNPDSVKLGFRVLSGLEEAPQRETADAFYEADQDLRELLTVS
jgi:hypothetical protein